MIINKYKFNLYSLLKYPKLSNQVSIQNVLNHCQWAVK